MPAFSDTLPPEQRLSIVDQINQEMVRRRITRKQLADMSKLLRVATVEDALNSKRPRFTLRTLRVFEDVFSKRFINDGQGKRETETLEAPEMMGSYTRKMMKGYIGEYVCIRPLFDDPRTLNVYKMDIEWSDADACLQFQEKDRYDKKHTQRGHLYFPTDKPFVNFLTIDQGDVRHIIVSRINRDGTMKGIMQTLYNQAAEFHLPASAPFVLQKTNGESFQIGKVDQKKSDYKLYREMLDSTVNDGYFRRVT